MSQNPDANRNVFSLMVDDWINTWYHQKTRPERQQIINEVRFYLRKRRLSEIDKNPELAVLREKRETARVNLEETQRKISEITAELQAWEARIEDLQSLEKQREIEARQSKTENSIVAYYRSQIAEGKIGHKEIENEAYHFAIQPEHERRFGKDAPITARMAIRKAGGLQ